MTVVALVSDLIFGSRIQTTAKAVGASVVIARTVAQFESALAQGVGMALVDMDAGEAAEACLRAAVAHDLNIPTVAFVSHVRGDLANTARKAGAAQVLSRSAFIDVLPGLLTDPGS